MVGSVVDVDEDEDVVVVVEFGVAVGVTIGIELLQTVVQLIEVVDIT